MLLSMDRKRRQVALLCGIELKFVQDRRNAFSSSVVNLLAV